MPYPIQNLLEGRSGPITIRSSERVVDAVAVMIEKEYSQLPVIDDNDRPLGMISHESIVQAVNNFPVSIDALLVSHAMVKADIFADDDDLFDLLDRLQDKYAVLIVNREKRLVGIVTPYDSTEYFRRRAEDLMLVEDIEGMLKDMVLAAFQRTEDGHNQPSLDQAIAHITNSRKGLHNRYKQALKQYLGKIGRQDLAEAIEETAVNETFEKLHPPTKPKQFEQLTLSEFIELLLHDTAWAYYGQSIKLEPNVVRKLLANVRETRNQLAHFRGEVSTTQRVQLRFCWNWLQQHQPSFLADWPLPVTSTAATTPVIRESRVIYQTEVPVQTNTTVYQDELNENEGRYALLSLYLQNQPPGQERITLSFSQIEEIIGTNLPASARRHRAWWANDAESHTHSRQWLEVGWRAVQVNMATEQVTFVRIRERERAYIDFFARAQAELQKKPGFPLRVISLDGQSWLSVAALDAPHISGIQFVYAFARRKQFRVELYIDMGIKDVNKAIFDKLTLQRSEIEEALGDELQWERLDDRRASRIAWYDHGSITASQDELTQLQAWAVDAMVKFYEVLNKRVVKP